MTSSGNVELPMSGGVSKAVQGTFIRALDSVKGARDAAVMLTTFPLSYFGEANLDVINATDPTTAGGLAALGVVGITKLVARATGKGKAKKTITRDSWNYAKHLAGRHPELAVKLDEATNAYAYGQISLAEFKQRQAEVQQRLIKELSGRHNQSRPIQPS